MLYPRSNGEPLQNLSRRQCDQVRILKEDPAARGEKCSQRSSLEKKRPDGKHNSNPGEGADPSDIKKEGFEVVTEYTPLAQSKYARVYYANIHIQQFLFAQDHSKHNIITNSASQFVR